MGNYIDTETVKEKTTYIEKQLEKLQGVLEEAKNSKEQGDTIRAFWSLYYGTEAILLNIKSTCNWLNCELEKIEKPFETEVDVYYEDNYIGKGELLWDFTLDESDDGIDRLSVNPKKLELDEDKLPEWFKDGDFSKLDWQIDLDVWYYAHINRKSSPAVFPEAVYIFEDPRKIIVGVEIKD